MIVGFENRLYPEDKDDLETKVPTRDTSPESIPSTRSLCDKFEELFLRKADESEVLERKITVPLEKSDPDRNIRQPIILSDGTSITLPSIDADKTQGESESVPDIFNRANAEAKLKRSVLFWLKENYPNIEKQWECSAGKNGWIELEKRKHLVIEFVSGLSETMDVTVGKVKFDKMPNNCYGSCELNRPVLHINEEFLKSPSVPAFALDNLLDTVIHELRHQYQKEAVADPDRFCASPAQVEAWRENLAEGNYILASEDYLGYRMQPVEKDAFAFAEEMIQKFKKEVEK